MLLKRRCKSKTKQHRRESMSKTLFRLHWLPMKARIKFRINLWVFKTLKGKAPSYMREMLVIKSGSRCTRLLEQLCLEIPRNTHKTIGDRCFSVAGLFFSIHFMLNIEIWICQSMISKRLQTHLFRENYSV